MLETFLRFFKQRQLSLGQQKFLLAVSGGLDSVVLCELSRQAGMHVAIAHCNFNLRGEESARDEAFVRSLAVKYNVEIFVAQLETAKYAAEQKLSIQEAARNLRYQWFEELRKANGFSHVLLAHHADDTIETLLFHFFRGTGIDGLTGIPQQNGRILRPMLHLRRSEIEAFAKANSLQWVEDSSNAESKYSRNFLRNEIIPQLKTVFPQVENALLRNIERLQGVQKIYAESIQAVKKKVCDSKGEEVHIPVLKLLRYKHTSLPYEIIKDFGFGEGAVGELWKLAEAESGRYIGNGQYRIIRHRRWFIIAPVAATATTFVLEKDDDFLQFGESSLRLQRFKKDKLPLDSSSTTAQLDAAEIHYPLVLRKWKAGDYFYPLGMQKKKKLARFFIDQKLSKTEKEKVWVLESHKRIVWVVGLRIDDRFKLTEKTTDVLRVTLSTL